MRVRRLIFLQLAFLRWMYQDDRAKLLLTAIEDYYDGRGDRSSLKSRIESIQESPRPMGGFPGHTSEVPLMHGRATVMEMVRRMEGWTKNSQSSASIVVVPGIRDTIFDIANDHWEIKNPRLRVPEVKRMAKAILQERRFGDVGVLADRISDVLDQPEADEVWRHLAGWRRCPCVSTGCDRCENGWIRKGPCGPGCWALHWLSGWQGRHIEHGEER